MAVSIEVPYEKVFQSPKSVEDTVRYLADWENSVPKNFPGVEKFESLGNDTYRWSFETVKVQAYEFGLKLVTRFSKPSATRIEVAPQPGGNCEFTGGWDVSPGSPTSVKFRARLQLDLPIPFFLKGVAAPLATKELTKFFDRYIGRVEKNIAT